MGNPHACCCPDKKNGWGKRKTKYFFFSVFRVIQKRKNTLDQPMSRFQLPSVKYVYAFDYKSRIGGYRTLLVMNSVNPFLIPLRYLIQSARWHTFCHSGSHEARRYLIGRPGRNLKTPPSLSQTRHY